MFMLKRVVGLHRMPIGSLLSVEQHAASAIYSRQRDSCCQNLLWNKEQKGAFWRATVVLEYSRNFLLLRKLKVHRQYHRFLGSSIQFTPTDLTVLVSSATEFTKRLILTAVSRDPLLSLIVQFHQLLATFPHFRSP